MPQNDISLRKDMSPEQRAAVPTTAEAFRDEMACADKWEAAHQQ